MVSWLELPGLGWMVVDPALLGLGLKHMLADDRGHLVNPSLHVLHVLSVGGEQVQFPTIFIHNTP